MNAIKYPRTLCLPFSPHQPKGDKTLADTKHFENCEVVITEKLDGENTTLYSDYIHARSIESPHHPSQAWVKKWHASIAHLIPKDFRFCGENMFAKHSIHYQDLKSYFYLFSVWTGGNWCMPWDYVTMYARMLNVPTPKELYRGIWSESKTKLLYNNDMEGFVVRVADGFFYKDFATSVAKYVRTGHVQIDEKHWKTKKIIPNVLLPVQG